MFNDNFNYTPSEGETKAFDKNFVFQKGTLFIPTYGSYDERTVLAPYTVLRDFSIEKIVSEFSEQLELHTHELGEEVNKIVALMVDSGYIRRAEEAAAYDFGAYRFLGDPVSQPATGSIISRSSEYLSDRLRLLKDNERNKRN